jgi:hypothetical protein
LVCIDCPARSEPRRQRPTPEETPGGGIRAAAGDRRGAIQGNTSRDHLHRILLILSELCNRRRPTLATLARLCEVQRRTIQRDIDQINALLGELPGKGNEIYFDHGKGGYVLRHPLTNLPILRLTLWIN